MKFSAFFLDLASLRWVDLVSVEIEEKNGYKTFIPCS